jgi:hypothetical protein
LILTVFLVGIKMPVGVKSSVVSQSHILKGFFFYNSAPSASINFTVEDISSGSGNTISRYSQNGFYEVDLADLPIGWTQNDTISVNATDRLGNLGQATIVINGSVSTEWANITLSPLQMSSFAGQYVELIVPSWYASIVEEYEMVNVLDQAFMLERELAKQLPPLFYEGNELKHKQAFAYNNDMDGGAGNGNPVQIGPGWFIVANGSGSYANLPRWFVFLHEMGHNWVPFPFPDLIPFNEGLASLLYLNVVQAFGHQSDNFGIKAKTYGQMVLEYCQLSNDYRESFYKWRANGSIYGSMGPYEVDGMLLELVDLYGWTLFERFFSIFASYLTYTPFQDVVVRATSLPVQEKITFIETVFNVASGMDLTPYFKNMNFAYNQTYSQEIEPILRDALYASDTTPPIVQAHSRVPEDNILAGQSVKISAVVSDVLSGVKNVTLFYRLNNETMWRNLPMNYNISTGLYETTIAGQQAGTLVKYEIAAYDNAGNNKTEDNVGQYYVYTVIPEFPSLAAILLFMTAILLAVIVCRRSLEMIGRKKTSYKMEVSSISL